MFDAWANVFPSGLMSGRISSFGEFDQCIKIKSSPIEEYFSFDSRYIYGRYCQVQLRIKVPDEKNYKPEWEDILKKNPISAELFHLLEKFKLDINLVKTMIQAISYFKGNFGNYGICIPNSCSPDEIESLFNNCKFSIIFIFKILIFLSFFNSSLSNYKNSNGHRSRIMYRSRRNQRQQTESISIVCNISYWNYNFSCNIINIIPCLFN